MGEFWEKFPAESEASPALRRPRRNSATGGSRCR